MELLGIFHKKTFMEARGVCEAPYIEKGGHALSARDAATSGGVMACALGRMRNAAALAEELIEKTVRAAHEALDKTPNLH